MCFQKRSCDLPRNAARRRSSALVKLSNSTISMGKYVRSGPVLFHRVCVRAHLHSVHLLPVDVCLCTCTFSRVFGLYLHEVRGPWFLTLVRGARKNSQWEVDVIHPTAAGLFVSPLTKERLDGQMNSVWGFTEKSYGSSSWRQICWPVLVHAQTRSLPVCSDGSPLPRVRPKETSQQLLKWVWALYEGL